MQEDVNTERGESGQHGTGVSPTVPGEPYPTDVAQWVTDELITTSA